VTLNEMALRIFCAYAGSISVQEAFAIAAKFEEQAKPQRVGWKGPSSLAFDDTGV
jgi:hypothetical protein